MQPENLHSKSTGDAPPAITVSVIVPCRNEAGHIGSFVENVARQRLPPGLELEIVIADGMSDDGTPKILQQLQARHRRLVVIHNPDRIVSAGLNLAIRRSSGSVIVRMDVHTQYAPDYVMRCVETLRQTGADNVGGPWTPAGYNPVSRAFSMVFASWLVSGGGKAHSPLYEGLVDTVYLGCWPREAFDQYGLFDETMVRSQDNEFNLRITRRGGQVWQNPRIRCWYKPRSSLRELLAQYCQYGYWKVRAIHKHRRPAAFRQLVPACFVLSLILLLAASLASSNAAQALAALTGVYVLTLICGSLHSMRGPGDLPLLPIAPLVIGVIQLGFGWGFLRGIQEFYLLGRLGRDQRRRRFSTLTRVAARTLDGYNARLPGN